ncbi:MAG: DNA polymerase I, partial [Deltaproteobacteria bacterium]|nr:DNA polymerase I [Deltaproteobacteria bacterium]
MARTVYLVDASLYIYRSYHAIRHLSTSSGQPTNAIYGFVSTISKLIREKKPEYIALAFDSKGPTFRHEIYPEYKANRPPMPEDLVAQQDYIRRAAAGFNITRLETPGMEADDIIASLSRQARDQGFEVVIVAGDKDFFQLLGQGVSLYDPRPKGDNYVTEESFRERFGIAPSGFLEAQGLMGDSTDNFSGVPGVGEKTALKLIQEFETLEGLYEDVGRVKQKGLRKKLEEHKESAFLARTLADLKTDIDFGLNLEDLKIAEPDIEALRELYQELEFNRLLSNLESLQSISYDDYHLVDTEEKLADLISELEGVEKLSVDLETTSTDPMRAEIVGFSFSAVPHRAFYLPVAHQDPAAPQISLEKALEALKPILESKKVAKAGQNIKYDYIILRRNGVTMKPVGDDSMIASYLL